MQRLTIDDFDYNWALFYGDSDETVYTHTYRDHQHVRIARAIDRDHNWYGLLHVGQLNPVDDRYTGEDRQPFDSYEMAYYWAAAYMETHPFGICADDVGETQHHYDWDDDKTYPIDF